MGCPPGEQHLSAARAGGTLPAFLHRAGVGSTRSKSVGWDSGQIRWVKLSADVFPGPRAAADPLRRWPVIRRIAGVPLLTRLVQRWGTHPPRQIPDVAPRGYVLPTPRCQWHPWNQSTTWRDAGRAARPVHRRHRAPAGGQHAVGSHPGKAQLDPQLGHILLLCVVRFWSTCSAFGPNRVKRNSLLKKHQSPVPGPYCKWQS